MNEDPKTGVTPVDPQVFAQRVAKAQKKNGYHAEPPPDPEYDAIVNGQLEEASKAVDEIAEEVPPHDLDAEAAVISRLILDPEVSIPKVRQILRAEQFYSEAHRLIGVAVFQLHDEGRVVDVVQVATRLREIDRIGQVGGMAYLTEVLDAAPVVVAESRDKHLEAYAHTVASRAIERDIILTCKDAVSSILAKRSSATAILSTLRSQIELVESPFEDRPGSTEDIFAPLPDIPFLCPALGIAPGAPYMFAGYGYSGKTLAAQQLGLAVASGRPLWGSHGVQVGRVLHVDYEQGKHLTRRRYQRLAYAMHLEKEYLADRLEDMIVPAFHFDSDAAASIFCRLGDGRKLVIIDSFRACAPSLEENSSEMRQPLDAAMRASEKTGCVFLFIHHARKASESNAGDLKQTIRGSSAIFDALGGVFVFSGTGKNEPVTVDHEKDRLRGRPVPTFKLEISDVDGERGVRIDLRDAPDPESTKQAQESSKAAEKQRQREETDRRIAAEKDELTRKREAGRRSKAQIDDQTLLEVIAAKPGLPVSGLRAEMAARLGECGRERVEQAVARQAGRLRVVEGEKNSKRHFLAIGDLSKAIEEIRAHDADPSAPPSTPKPVSTWSEAADVSAKLESDTDDQ